MTLETEDLLQSILILYNIYIEVTIMKINMDELLDSMLEGISNMDYVRSEDIPNIELYMDQVTTFMDSRLKNAARNPEVDKILTKTMINNYAKNDLLPPPVRKKYSREHMLLLIFIYYFKGILSISDIQTVLKPITDRFFAGNEGLKLETIYNEVFSLEREEVEVMKQDVVRKYHKAQETFSDAAAEDQEFLQTFSFICMLSFDVYVKKMLIEKLIDSCSAKETDTTEHRSRHSRSDKKQ